jgi:hypothetical protein
MKSNPSNSPKTPPSTKNNTLSHNNQPNNSQNKVFAITRKLRTNQQSSITLSKNLNPKATTIKKIINNNQCINISTLSKHYNAESRKIWIPSKLNLITFHLPNLRTNNNNNSPMYHLLHYRSTISLTVFGESIPANFPSKQPNFPNSN